MSKSRRTSEQILADILRIHTIKDEAHNPNLSSSDVLLLAGPSVWPV